MATPQEAFPDDQFEEPVAPDVAAHLGRVPHEYEQDGEVVEMPNPGNFPMILHAYMLNRFDKEGRWIYVQNYQKSLRDLKVGHFITQAIDAIYEKEMESTIEPALRSPLKDSLETRINHAIVIEEVKPYLPDGVDSAVLYDLPFEDLEAA
jgi:hypothetical protein